MRIALALLIPIWLHAQEPAPQPPVLLKATTRLVQVNVVAQDGKGNPIADLNRDDFAVKVNGKVQPVAFFSVDSSGSLPRASAPLPPNLFTNLLEANARTPSGVTIILLDTRNTRTTDQMYAKAQVIRYLRTVHPEDHIGLYAFGATLKVLHDYTADSTDLIRRLQQTKGQLPDLSSEEGFDAMQGDALALDGWVGMLGGASQAERAFYTTDRILSTLRALEFIANHLARVPGRKNLIWVSGGFPLQIGFDNLSQLHDPAIDQRAFADEVDHAVRAINDANMAIYPVDARGLMTDPRFDASRRGGAQLNPAKQTRIPAPVGAKNQEAMFELADRTGGRAFVNTNDLSKAIHEAVEDSRVTYTLGFYPLESHLDGKFHKIDVHVERSGVKLRYRKGYFDLAEAPQDDKARKAELNDAAWSPMDATGVGLVAQVVPSKTNARALDVTLKIDHTGVSLEQQADRWAGRLDLLFVQRDERGSPFRGVDDTLSLRLTQASFDKAMKEDLAYTKTIDRASDAQTLRIVVRDGASGAIGSVTVPLARVAQ